MDGEWGENATNCIGMIPHLDENSYFYQLSQRQGTKETHCCSLEGEAMNYVGV